MTDTLVD